jgi:hypothetical protein
LAGGEQGGEVAQQGGLAEAGRGVEAEAATGGDGLGGGLDLLVATAEGGGRHGQEMGLDRRRGIDRHRHPLAAEAGAVPTAQLEAKAPGDDAVHEAASPVLADVVPCNA